MTRLAGDWSRRALARRWGSGGLKPAGYVRSVSVVIAMVCVLAGALVASAQVAMPNPKDMSGTVLPVTDVPVGTITVRVIRGGFDKVIAGQAVEFTIDGKKRTVKTDVDGRATVSGLAPGTRVQAVAIVDGERLESQEAVVADSGLRVALVATDPDAVKRAEQDKALAEAPAVKGLVVLGPETRFIAEMQNDQLTVFYLLQIVNSARTPVDIGGPFVVDLPREARGATVMEGSTPKATANGPRITILGPFAPGITSVQAAFELPYSGGTARIDQKMPAALEQVTVVVQQIGGLTLASPQLAAKREVNDQGQALILGTGPGLAAGQALTLEISGLPHRASWPKNLALALAGLIAAAGLWSAITAAPRRAAA
jgi:hypothetical protein